ncbi:MAG: FdtA/QdtA family cupin domain-containing protein [Lachnospiraceae bacterium]|nr:FdtA/QdtA family cupin domain-containing protein [Lachnospiraceae bacterium]
MKIEMYQFQQHGDDRGQLAVLEENKDIPFEVKRVYYLFGTKEGVVRGLHAHKKLQQILVCVNGSCKIKLDDGLETGIIELNKPTEGLYVGPDQWREMYDFSKDAVLLVLASELYNEEDYIRDYNEFLKWTKEKKNTIAKDGAR